MQSQAQASTQSALRRLAPWAPHVMLTHGQRVRTLSATIYPLLRGERLLDLGCGKRRIAHALAARARSEGHPLTVVPLDVTWRPSAYPLPQIVALGEALPLPDHAVETTLLAYVLHHADDPDAVLAEVRRVTSQRVILLEDTPDSAAAQIYTGLFDQLLNRALDEHPHNNRTSLEWQAAFRTFARTVTVQPYNTIVFGVPMIGTLYVLDL